MGRLIGDVKDAARRQREIGIRMALGADRGKVVWMVMREVFWLVAIGVAMGVPAALALMRPVQSQLFGLTAHDPATPLLTTGILTFVACLAGYIPAARTSHLNPVVALHHE